jgi:NAD(P)-dependent dehydrogenase (short-subunit alcohol dehydrogenase family)
VVTGGGRGIGAAAAGALAAQGASVVVAARTRAQVESVAAELCAAGARAFAASVDVAHAESVEALAARAVGDLGGVDILVNNAGIAPTAPLTALGLEEWERTMAVNATGTFLCTRAFLPAMLERGFGRIVNVASIAATRGGPYIAAYTASKHAVLGFTRAAAAELAGRGVTVNAVCPGYVDTEMTNRAFERISAKTGRSPGDARKAVLAGVGQERMLTADEVARAIVALCEGDATGQAVILDGRSSMPLQIVKPEGWERPQGYSDGILAPSGGRLLFVAGQVGWDGRRVVCDDLPGQLRKALENVVAVVRAAGGEVRHLARLTLYVVDKEEYLRETRAIGEAYRAVMGHHYPAMALLEVRGFVEPGAKVEIEATAVLP